MTQKNEIVAIGIVALTSEGDGIGVLPDGMKIFVPFTAVGDRARVQVLAVKKNVAYGRVREVIAPSPDRVAPCCPVFAKCGGCKLQHLSRPAQLAFRRQTVADALTRIGHIDCAVAPTLAPSAPYGYRNKIQLPIGVGKDGGLAIGFYRANSHDIVDIDACPLHGAWASDLIAAIRAYAARAGVTGYDETTRKGVLRHVVARMLDGRLLVCIVTATRALPAQQTLTEQLAARFSHFTLTHSVNAAPTNVILGKTVRTLVGEGALTTEWLGIEARVQTQSFLQVNTETALALYRAAADAAGQSDVVVDAYAGAGVMSAIFARTAKRVYGVELCREASLDADAVKAANGADNLENINGDCADVLPALLPALREKDPTATVCVVLDPPRKGCAPSVLRAVRAAAPERIVYLSCDPATLARDLAFLTADAYAVDSVTPYEMFPQTAHVETLVVLSHKKPDGHIGVKVEFGEEEGQISLKEVEKRAEERKPKEKVTY